MLKIWILLLLALTSCAYNISSEKKQIPGGYNRVFLPPFSNQTQLPGIEVYFTNFLSRELQRTADTQITDQVNSHVTVEGVINKLYFAPTAPLNHESLKQLPNYTSLFGEYRIFLEATVTLRRNSDNKVLWSGVVRGEKSYVAPQVGSAGINSVNALYNHSARHQHIAQLAQDMMVEAVDRMTEQF